MGMTTPRSVTSSTRLVAACGRPKTSSSELRRRSATCEFERSRVGEQLRELVASLLLVVRPGAPSSFLFLVAMPFVPSSFVKTCTTSSPIGMVKHVHMVEECNKNIWSILVDLIDQQ